MELASLPDDILLLIIEHFDIASFCQLRLCCRSIHELILVYWNKFIPRIAKTNYPSAPRLLINEPPNGEWSLQWLGQIKFKYLATVLADRLCTSYFKNDKGIIYSIPAAAPEGDALRARLINGWLLLHRLSKALHEVDGVKHRLKLVQHMRIRAKTGEMFGTTRDALWYHDRVQQTAKLLQSVSEEEGADFLLLWELLRYVFRTDRDDAPASRTGVTGFFDWGSPLSYCATAGSWTDWLVLYHSPELFWTQWSVASPQYRRHKAGLTTQLMLEEWRKRDSKQIDGERNTARMILKLVWKPCGSRISVEFGTGVRPAARLYFDAYLLQRERDHEMAKDGLSNADMRRESQSMDDIPFLVDFRSVA